MRLGEIRQKIAGRFRSTPQVASRVPQVEIIDVRSILEIPRGPKNAVGEDTPPHQNPNEVVLIIANSRLQHVGKHVVTIPKTPASLK